MVVPTESNPSEQRRKSFELMLELTKVQPGLLKVTNGSKGAVTLLLDGAEEIRKYLYPEK